jgi:hypothetical protein
MMEFIGEILFLGLFNEYISWEMETLKLHYTSKIY